MNTLSHKSRPGDLILNRYMLNATEEERVGARENLRAYAMVILRIATRLATEEYEQEIRATETHEVKLQCDTAPL